jgi:hypothetical protein
LFSPAGGSQPKERQTWGDGGGGSAEIDCRRWL